MKLQGQVSTGEWGILANGIPSMKVTKLELQFLCNLDNLLVCREPLQRIWWYPSSSITSYSRFRPAKSQVNFGPSE